MSTRMPTSPISSMRRSKSFCGRVGAEMISTGLMFPVVQHWRCASAPRQQWVQEENIANAS
jgi:hypothetical protein